MLIAEHLALIALDPVSGIARFNLKQAHEQRFLAACLLMELGVQTRLGARGDVVVVLDTLPSRHPLLTQSLRIVREASGRMEASDVIRRVASGIPRLREELLDALVRRDILHPPRKQHFNLFGTRMYPVRSMQAQNEAMEHLHQAAVGTRNDLKSLAMMLLAHASGLARQLLTAHEAEEASSRVDLLLEEIELELAHNAELLDEQFSIQLMAKLAQTVRGWVTPIPAGAA
jgi:hypothetical protein